MPNIVKHCKIILYADDTLLYYSSNSVKDIELCVNEDLHSICKWLDENLLTLNCAKSKFLLFGGNRRLKTFTNISIYVNDQQLAREQTFKYLGITFSENLTWSDHISNVSIKINQRIGLLRRVKVFIPLKARLTIYNSLILPLFDYADIIWGDKNNTTLMDQLQIHRRYLHRMLTIFKLKNNLIDYDFDLPKANHLHNTRQRDHIHLSKPCTNWGKQKLLYQACKEYNDLNKNIRSINNLASFHTALLKSP